MRRLAKGALLALATYVTIGPFTGSISTVSASCGQGCFRDWELAAVSTCGACTTLGTEEDGYVPTSFSVTQDPIAGLDPGTDAMNEAAWLLNKNDSNQGTETGYFSGWWPYTEPHSWNGCIKAYGTYNNGYDGSYNATCMTGGDNYYAYSDATGRESRVVQQGAVFWTCYCWPAVGTPRYNFAHGEVHAYSTDQYGTPWLGNGSGQTFYMYFQSSSGGWGLWSSLTLEFTSTTGSISPYNYSKQNVYTWTNWGY